MRNRVENKILSLIPCDNGSTVDNILYPKILSRKFVAMNLRQLLGFLMALILGAITGSAQNRDSSGNSAPHQIEGASEDHLKSRVIELLKHAHSKDALLENFISKQYKKTAQNILTAEGSNRGIAEVVASDFNYYSIVSIERVTTQNNIAFIEAKIRYNKEALEDIREEEKESSESGSENSTLWGSGGGSSFENQCEKDGIGIATYYLVLQDKTWRVHYTYFSIKPLSERDQATAAKFLRTISN